MAAIVAAGLPKAIRSYQTNYPSIYKSDLQYGAPDQLIYELGLYHSTIQNFNLAKEEEKAIGLKVSYYESANASTPPKTGEFKYMIQKSELIDKEANLWKLSSGFDKNISGDYKFPQTYPKDFGFLCIPYSWVKLTGKNDAVLASIPYPPATSSGGSTSGSGGCFLTTACTAHKGLADDCEELTTLRFLRNEFMLQDEEGQLLIEQYNHTGPQIVQAINNCDNKRKSMNTCTGK